MTTENMTTVNVEEVPYADKVLYSETGTWGNTGISNNQVGSGNISLRVRRKLSSEWEAITDIIPEGEPCFAIDTGELKIGDGINLWKDLTNILGLSHIIYTYGDGRFLEIDDGELV